ncbi:transcription repressor NadR [uncultured Rummeliibacillus sp.]|uniref:transcription repressor NadR n=1 Tax=uncultured Rummeliibacillus sp. TaxID=762292 RepID=UPI00262038AB|nr:transcription repressor NadR [uncultured Rummeliibacillus sp.]
MLYMKKLLGEERRAFLLNLLKTEETAITGTELAKRASVSRQVIVNDIALLKARNEPIIATSQGYLYFNQHESVQNYERQIAALHTSEQTEDELNTLVDAGITVKDVTVEHPVYGEITANIMVKNRFDVQQFLKKLQETNASPLMALTDGAHLHTISAPSEAQLDLAEKLLKEKGYLLS